MTEKLYYSNPKVNEWTTKVTSIHKEDHSYWVQLDETAFYPEGGGQPADLGYIGGIEVLDVQEVNDQVLHKVAVPIQEKEVICSINWNRRLDHTQHHSGQHLLSAVIIELFDAQTISFHLGKETVTIDLDVGDLGESQLKEIEHRANQYIFENRKIRTFIASKEELETLALRKMPKVTENIRIVEMDGIDISACCGTHVYSTSEIGIIKILKTEKQKGKTRLHFICGMRALKYFQEIHDNISLLAAKFSTSTHDVINRIDKLEHEISILEKQNAELTQENSQYLADHILQTSNESCIISIFENKELKDLQLIARLLVEKSNLPVILGSESELKLVVTTPSSFDFHCGKWCKENLSKFDGKGGGNERQAQASFTSFESMNLCIESLRDSLKISI